MIDRLISYALPVALAALAGGLLAVLGARVRLLPPLPAFGLFALSVLGGGGAAFVLGLWGIVRGAGPDGASRVPTIVAGAIGLGCVAFIVVIVAGAGRAPTIHDITTDPENPPVFVEAARNPANRGRDLAYPDGAADTAALQRAAYPDLNPIVLQLPADEAFEAALEVAAVRGWKVVARDDAARTFEAEDETSVFRFVDDIVVRVRESDGNAIVDVRSTSRVGEGDMGVNAERIRWFRDALLTGRR